MKKKISIIQTMRHTVQLIFFLLLPGLYISTFSGIKQIYLAIIGQGTGLTQLLPQIIEVVSIIPITFLLGRFFCGWMCSFGSLGDLIYEISSKLVKFKFKVNKTTDQHLKLFKYTLLIFLIAIIWTMSITDFASFNPWDVFGNLATITQVPNFNYIASNFMPGLIIFGLIIIGSAFIERFFCRYMCPLGAVFAITSKLRIAKIKKPSAKCGNCRICTNNCPMGIPLYKGNEVLNGECIQCMKCISACPRKNVSLTISDKDVRPILAGAAAVSVMTGFYYAGNLGVNASGLTTGTTVTSSANSSSSSTIYLDGTYTGSGTGFRGATTKVSVTVKNGKITDVSTLSTGDDMPYYNRAFSTVSSEIVDNQSTSVDSVSGATFSSRGIMAAVQDALSNATVTNGSSSTSAGSSVQSQTSVTTPAATKSTASVSNSTTAQNTATTKTTASTSTASTNTTSTSTTAQSSAAATTKSGYTDGTYTGSGTGFRGATTTVSVTIKNGKITDITTISTGDDKPYYNRAFSTVSSEIKSSQSTSVDTVSGATFSSRGIMTAVQNALSKAK
ncbi:MAG: FMN-binding protein [Solirubrobacterales bacterium]